MRKRERAASLNRVQNARGHKRCRVAAPHERAALSAQASETFINAVDELVAVKVTSKQRVNGREVVTSVPLWCGLPCSRALERGFRGRCALQA